MEVNTTVGAGRFTLVRPLGRGGMGEVWLAQDEWLHEPVALKFLPAEVRGDAAALDDLHRETARSHKLSHPNIVRIHDLHEDASGAGFIAMEFVDGPTLAALRVQQPERVLSWEFLKPLVQQLCAALEYAHGERVIHRDLKPANMLLDGKDRLKLADFGIAATVSDSVSRVSHRHATSGTLAYMSPQQLTGKRPQIADDIYALGATLYELLASQPPFCTGDLTHQILNECPEPLTERLAALGIQNEVPADVAAIIMACLAKDSGQRPQSVRAVAEWIGLETAGKPSTHQLVADVSSGAQESELLAEAGTPILDDAAASRSFNRAGMWTGVAVIALMLFTIAGLYWWTHPSRKGAPTAREHTGVPGSSLENPETAAPPNATAAGSRPNDATESGEPGQMRIPVTPPSGTTPPGPPETLQQMQPSNGFISLFNGRDLTGWSGDPQIWSIQNGILTGRAKLDPNRKGGGFLIWTNGNVSDFELRFSFRVPLGNSGVAFRGINFGNWAVFGGQYVITDLTSPGGEIGQLFESGAIGNQPRWISGRGHLGLPGANVIVNANRKITPAGPVTASKAQALAALKMKDWNEGVILARGEHLVHSLNGMVVTEVRDRDMSMRRLSGVLGIQAHAVDDKGALVEFKDIRLKRLSAAARASAALEVDQWQAVLERSGIQGKLWRNAMGQLSLVLDKSTRDIALLKGIPLHTLFAAESQVRDLTPLQGMPLKVLGLRRTQVSDLSPLKGMSVEQLALDECENLQDLRPLAECLQLESLSIPASVQNIDFLRRLPNLKHLAYSSPADGKWERVTTAAEFWRKFSPERPRTTR